MKTTAYSLLLLLAATALTTSCSSTDSDSNSPLVINIPAAADDECCSLDDELAMRSLFADYKEVEHLTGIVFGKYTVRVYARYATLRVGFNELLFAVEKTETAQHVKDIQFSDLVPLMTMGTMGMKHSSPVGNTFRQVTVTYAGATRQLPVYRTWFAPVMPSDENSFWELSVSYNVKGSDGKSSNLRFTVDKAPDGQTWLKSFKHDDHTYYLTLANAADLQTGVNTIQAYVSRTGDDKTLPYYEATDEFTIEITPTMPDMGNHSSPGNEPLTRQPSGIYEGRLNLSMTGRWNIHLVVKDRDGNTVAGADTDTSGYSSLFWTVTI